MLSAGLKRIGEKQEILKWKIVVRFQALPRLILHERRTATVPVALVQD
jgi:hypothetical protein